MSNKPLSDYIVQTLAGLTVLAIGGIATFILSPGSLVVRILAVFAVSTIILAAVGYVLRDRLAPLWQHLRLLSRWLAGRRRYILYVLAIAAFVLLEAAFLSVYHDWQAIMLSIGFAAIVLGLLIASNPREARQQAVSLNERKKDVFVNLDLPENCIQTIPGLNGWVHSLAFSTDGKMLASAGDDDHVKLWPWLINKVGNPHNLGGNPEGTTQIRVTAFTFLSNPRYLAAGSEHGEIKIWDFIKREERTHFAGHAEAIRCLATNYTQTNSLLASGADDGIVGLWKMPYGEREKSPDPSFRDRVSTLAFSPERNLLIASAADRQIYAWDIERMSRTSNEKEYTAFDEFKYVTVSSVAFSPDGRWLALALDNKTIRISRISENIVRMEFNNLFLAADPMQPLLGHFQEVRSVVFSPDGRLLASASNDKTIKLWDVKNDFKAIDSPLEGHNNHVVSLAFSPDSKLLASGSHGEIKIWSLR